MRRSTLTLISCAAVATYFLRYGRVVRANNRGCGAPLDHLTLSRKRNSVGMHTARGDVLHEPACRAGALPVLALIWEFNGRSSCKIRERKETWAAACPARATGKKPHHENQSLVTPSLFKGCKWYKKAIQLSVSLSSPLPHCFRQFVAVLVRGCSECKARRSR